MKSYTDINQSRKLAEILPLNSADMTWSKETTITDETEWYITLGLDRAITDDSFSYRHGYLVPGWSLAALLEYLRNHHLFPEIMNTNNGIIMDITFYDDDETEEKTISSLHFIRAEGENIIDACYELILKLHEEKML